MLLATIDINENIIATRMWSGGCIIYILFITKLKPPSTCDALYGSCTPSLLRKRGIDLFFVRSEAIWVVKPYESLEVYLKSQTYVYDTWVFLFFLHHVRRATPLWSIQKRWRW